MGGKIPVGCGRRWVQGWCGEWEGKEIGITPPRTRWFYQQQQQQQIMAEDQWGESTEKFGWGHPYLTSLHPPVPGGLYDMLV